MARRADAGDTALPGLLSQIMDSNAFVALVMACAPLVHPMTAQALVKVGSSFNPHAIGVVGGALRRQPRSSGEAIATATALQNAGWNFSIGLAQINVNNLERLGLSVGVALDPCENLKAMQVVLSECFERAGPGSHPQHEVRQALSCYYSGNYVTGFSQGYVARVVDASRRPVRSLSRAPP